MLFVSSLFKRPYILDLLPERSLVQTFLREGFSVYLTDWLPPLSEDAGRGLHDYVNCDLARAVECVRKREGVEGVSLVGCCLGGLLSVIYAALHPHNVERLVPFALPFESRPPFPPGAAAQLVSLYGNVPAWWIRMAMNARVSNPFQLPAFLAEELGEPELAQSGGSQPTDVQYRLERWFGSDVPLAGRLFCEVMQDAFGDSQFAEGRLRVGDQRVALEHVECPVLNISAERDLRRAAARQRFIHRAGTQPRGEQPRLSKRTPWAHGQSRGARDSLAVRRDVASRRPGGSRARPHCRTSPLTRVAPLVEAPRNSR